MATAGWPKGERAAGLVDKRFVSTYLYAAVRPTTDDAFALVFPEVNANTMDIFLDRFAAPEGGTFHSVKSGRIPLKLSRTHGSNRIISL
jgi:hypothetical protein